MLSNQPFLDVNSSSGCFPSESQPFFSSPFPLHNLQLFDGDSSSESSSIPLEQESYDRLIGSRESNSIIEHELFQDSTQTSTGFVESQSVTVAGFSREQKCEVEHKTLLLTNSEYSSFYPLNTENKGLKSTKGKKRRKAVYTPEELKDDKYWGRRQRNNLAAKKWRETKRRTYNSAIQKVIRLEIENTRLRLEMSCLREQNQRLKEFFDSLAQ